MITKKHILSWAAVAAWMAVIFCFSGQTGDDSGGLSEGIVRWFVGVVYRGFDGVPPAQQMEILEAWHLLIRKGAHFTEYAVLAALIANALRSYSISSKLKWWLPVVASAVYAVTDEMHQYFVPGRACRLLDVGIDTCGAIFGTALFTLGVYFLSKKHRT